MMQILFLYDTHEVFQLSEEHFETQPTWEENSSLKTVLKVGNQLDSTWVQRSHLF